jgi:hypothetical protein
MIELLKDRMSPLTPEGVIGSDLLREKISTFRVLLYFPLEYFNFQVLNGFIGCAIEMDEALVGMWKKGEWEEGDGREEAMKGLAVLRVFVRRVCVYIGGSGSLDFRVGLFFTIG